MHISPFFTSSVLVNDEQSKGSIRPRKRDQQTQDLTLSFLGRLFERRVVLGDIKPVGSSHYGSERKAYLSLGQDLCRSRYKRATSKGAGLSQRPLQDKNDFVLAGMHPGYLNTKESGESLEPGLHGKAPHTVPMVAYVNSYSFLGDYAAKIN